MNAIQATYSILDNMPEGYTFTGSSLEYNVEQITGKWHYPATILRMMRMWRRNNREVKCINRAKSLYKIGAKL